MPTVLHVLPHAGGGAETYLRLLADLEGFEQERIELSSARTPVSAIPSIALRGAEVARGVRSADVVHVHGDAALLLTLPLLGLTPSVWTTHGLHLLRRRPRIAPAVRAAIGRTRLTICTSEAEQRELAEIAPRLRGRLRLVPNGVPLPEAPDPQARAAIREELGLQEDELAVLFLGELEQRKRPLEAVAAAEMARAAGAPVTLVVAGAGPLEAAVRRRSGQAVRVLGFRNDPQRLLAGCDVFILPSIREGHSFALLEAMGRGIPVVVSGGAGNPEAVGDAGVVVRAEHPSALADTFRQLAEQPQLRHALGVAARERVAASYTPERLRAGVRDAYWQALKAPGRAASDAPA
jgi:glycosyltransferase involved in cell wall biosynthesis